MQKTFHRVVDDFFSNLAERGFDADAIWKGR